MHSSSHRIQLHLQLIHRLPEIPEPVEQLSDSRERAVLDEGPHAEDLGFGDLLDAPYAILVCQQLNDFPGPTPFTSAFIHVHMPKGVVGHHALGFCRATSDRRR